MKKNFGLGVICAVVMMAAGAGCRSNSAEYYRELSGEQRAALEHSARVLVVQAKVVPEHLLVVFEKLPGHERIVYTGDCRGKAEYRWEIYDNLSEGSRATQRDVNPFWVRVYAEGDLLDPQWKLSHSKDSFKPPVAGANPEGSVRLDRPQRGTVVRPEAPPARDTVRYRR